MFCSKMDFDYILGTFDDFSEYFFVLFRSCVIEIIFLILRFD